MTHKRHDGFVLKPEYEDLNAKFEAYGTCCSCSCHLHPPCGHCTAEGNIENLREDPEAWEHPLKAAVRAEVEKER